MFLAMSNAEICCACEVICFLVSGIRPCQINPDLDSALEPKLGTNDNYFLQLLQIGWRIALSMGCP